jgi:hypothetical protein
LLKCALPGGRGASIGHNPENRETNQRRLLNALIESLELRRLLSKTICVDSNPSITIHDGSAWASAYSDLQQALTAAVSGDQIRVADGTYKPTSTTSRTISFTLKTGVALYGGYAGFGATDPNARDIVSTASVLSGDIGAIGDISDNSIHIVVGTNADASAILNGFTITDGNATTNGGLASTFSMEVAHRLPTARSMETGPALAAARHIYSSRGLLSSDANSSTTPQRLNKASGVTFSSGDFNYDGRVNALDFNALASRFGTTLARPAGSPAALTALQSAAAMRDLFGDNAISARSLDVLEN